MRNAIEWNPLKSNRAGLFPCFVKQNEQQEVVSFANIPTGKSVHLWIIILHQERNQQDSLLWY